MMYKTFLPLFIVLFIASCMPTPIPTEPIVSTDVVSHPTFTFTPNPTLTKISTVTITVTPTQTPTPTFLASPDPDLIKEFTGKYHMENSGLFICDFEIRHDSTFAIRFINPPNGATENIEGSISIVDGRFVLTPTGVNVEDIKMPRMCFYQTLMFVTWGGRKYLLPDRTDEFSSEWVSLFCEDITDGYEPRNKNNGDYYLQENDFEVKTTGIPLSQGDQAVCP